MANGVSTAIAEIERSRRNDAQLVVILISDGNSQDKVALLDYSWCFLAHICFIFSGILWHLRPAVSEIQMQTFGPLRLASNTSLESSNSTPETRGCAFDTRQPQPIEQKDLFSA